MKSFIRTFTLIAGSVILLNQSIWSDDPNLPDLGDSESAVLSQHDEELLGSQILMQFRRSGALVKDPIIKYFVKSNLYELAQYSEMNPSDLHPIIIDSPELNALAAPGGIIGIHVGLFSYAHDIHEYSSVIAHELAHLSQRHFARRLDHDRRTRLTQSLAWVASSLVFAMGGDEAGLAGLAATTALNERLTMGYSRAQEREADRIGLETLKQAGYDPEGAMRLFLRLQDQQKYEAELEVYRSTHPLTTERISDLRVSVQEPEEQQYPSSDDYQLVRARTVHSFFDSPLEAKAHAQNLSDDSIYTKYLQALALQANDEFDAGVKIMEEVVKTLPGSIIAASCFADYLIEVEQEERAIEEIDDVLANTPGSTPLRLMKVRAFRALHKYEQAAKLLAKVARQNPEDTELWFDLAEIQGLAKNTLEVHRARAEYYGLVGNFADAIKHLQLAKRINDGGSELIDARIDQKILEFRRLAELNS